MQLDKFIAGLNILSRFYDKPDGYHIGSEHDVFFCYKTDKPLDRASVEQMVELGWFQHEVECPDDGDFTADCYDADESWSAYT